MRITMIFITFLFAPMLSFADCNMDIGGCKNPHSGNNYSADAHGPTLAASDMFSKLAEAIAAGAGMSVKAQSEGNVIYNKQASESLNRIGEAQRRAKEQTGEGEDSDSIK